MLKDFYLSFSAVCFTLLALVDPDSFVLWRVSFAAAAIGGAVALITLRGPAPGKLGPVGGFTSLKHRSPTLAA